MGIHLSLKQLPSRAFWQIIFLVTCCLLPRPSSGCSVFVFDKTSNKPIVDAHLFYGENISITTTDGRAELLGDTDNGVILTFSHIGYAAHEQNVKCGDTIYLEESVLALTEISIVSQISKRDLSQFYNNLKKSLKSLGELSGRGVAENSVYFDHTLYEYKSFIFNGTQSNGVIDELNCVNSFVHVRTDTSWYFENIHRLLERVNLNPSKGEVNSWIQDFLYNKEHWSFQKRVDLGTGESRFSFSKEDQEIWIWFKMDRLSTIEWKNPRGLISDIEINHNRVKEVSGDVVIRFDILDHDKLFIEEINGKIDLHLGALSTQFRAKFDKQKPYRESIISAMENARNEYLIYVLLHVEEPLISLESIALPNGPQLRQFINEVEPIPTEDLLLHFGMVPLPDTSEFDSLVYGEHIQIHPGANSFKFGSSSFIEDYYNLVPLTALHAIVFDNHQTGKIESNTYLDPGNTRFIQFYDSNFNEEWRKRQMQSLKTLNVEITSYLDTVDFLSKKSNEVDDETWKQTQESVEALLTDYLKSSLHEKFGGFLAGSRQFLRMNSRR